MKINLAKIVLIVIFLTVSIFNIKADYVTLLGPGGTGASASFRVPTNVVAEIVYANNLFYTSGSSSAGILVVFDNAPGVAVFASFYTTLPSPPPIFVGPATITLYATNTVSKPAFCTIKTTPAINSSTNFTPSSSVVIPNDSGGPVTIILESSTDLVNWVEANPGTYGTTSTNRFFRVKAQR